MTKESYYEMCKAMGTNPEKGDIPIDYDDLSFQSKKGLELFDLLPDLWDGMQGTYQGKNLNNIEFFLKILDIDKSSWLIITRLLTTIISFRVKSVNDTMKNKAKAEALKDGK